MWKGTPVIGGDYGGIRLQIQDGQTGFLVCDVSSCAEHIVYLLTHQDVARRVGAASHAAVLQHALMPRLLRDYLELAGHLTRLSPPTAAVEATV